jgi:hypothetical protein
MPAMVLHGSALSQKICMAGLTERGSSSVPTGIIVNPAITSAVWVMVEPHSGQNARCVGLPLSLVSSKDFVVPVTVRAAVGTATTVPYADPVDFWHDRQWQMPTKTGSAEDA